MTIIDVWNMPAAERAALYRQRAADAEAFAHTTDVVVSRHYITIAEHWRKMAADIEAQEVVRQTGETPDSASMPTQAFPALR